MFSLLQVFVSTRHQKIFLFCSMVIWQKKRQKNKDGNIFFGIFLFSRRYVLLFFQRWREQSAVHFFLSFLEVVTAYICNRQKTFLNIFFVFKFRKFRFWFLMLHQCIEREPDDFTYFLLWYVFFWLLMIFFVDKIMFVLLRWCYFKVCIKLQLSLRTKTYAQFFKDCSVAWKDETLMAYQPCAWLA